MVTVYEEDGAVKKFFVSSGSVSINKDASVQILAEEAHPVEDIDGASAKDILAKAQAKVSSTSDEVCTLPLFGTMLITVFLDGQSRGNDRG